MSSDVNQGVGWYEVIHPTTATSEIVAVMEDGSIYCPAGVVTRGEFVFSAARGDAHRLVRADVLHEAALNLVGRAWDDGNGSGLDGWIGPGRGAGEIDAEALRRYTAEDWGDYYVEGPRQGFEEGVEWQAERDAERIADLEAEVERQTAYAKNATDQQGRLMRHHREARARAEAVEAKLDAVQKALDSDELDGPDHDDWVYLDEANRIIDAVRAVLDGDETT